MPETLKDCIHIVNFFKATALNSRNFSLPYEETGSEPQSLFHTSVRLVSRGKVLAKFFELRHEIRQFVLSQNNHHLYKHLKDDHWIAKLSYVADKVELLNEINIKMQGKKENILTCSDKLKGFKEYSTLDFGKPS